MAEATKVQLVLEQPLSYRAETLLGDVRPLRAHFEDLALTLRATLQQQGIVTPWLEATLDLCYEGASAPITVPFPLEIENAAVCLSDPLPLDGQALRQALAAFREAYRVQAVGAVAPDVPIEIVRLRVHGYGYPKLP